MTTTEDTPPRLSLSRAALASVYQLKVLDHLGQSKEVSIPGELPLTVKVDGREIVTLMTLGTNPEELALGYLHNQRLLERIEDVQEVSVDWVRETVNVSTRHGQGIPDLEAKLSRVTVTSGCGQGTLFSCTVDKLYERKLPKVQVRQSTLKGVLQAVAHRHHIYRLAGSVHGCGLCQAEQVLMYVEDVGRHNAADAIAGRMWLDGLTGEDKLLYTTGRLTSEIMMKAAFMGIPVLLSKSGVTQMGLEMARNMGMVVIGRARGHKFLVFNGANQVVFDAIPHEEPPEA
ncbi:Sulfur carrier protein FdhD [Desulfarculales bacterium]